MATLADFKRKIKSGALIHGIKHFEPVRDEQGNVVWENGKPLVQDKDLGVAPISIVQTNSFAFKRGDKNSWLDFPKASNLVFDGTKAEIYFEDKVNGRLKAFTYTFVG